MIRKAEGIVLNTRKFQESSLLTKLYTREYGVQSFIVQGVRSVKSRKKFSYFQPMSITDIVFYYKETRDLQRITESSSRVFLETLQTSPIKISLGLFCTEVFTQSVREEEANILLYDFYKRTLLSLDHGQEKLIHLLLFFLVHLTKFIGFFPHYEVSNPEGPQSFDLIDGTIRNDAPGVPEVILLGKIMHSSFENVQEILFSNQEKRNLIDLLLRYYKCHIENFRDPESLAVFREVLGD